METRISIKNIYLLAVISIGLIGLGVGSTFAMFTAEATIENPISFASNLSSGNDLTETIEVTVPAYSDKLVDLAISNTTASSLNYKSWYVTSSNTLELGSTTSNNSYGPTGELPTSTNFTLTVTLRNRTSSSVLVTLGVTYNTSSVNLLTGSTQIPLITLPTLINENAATYITNLYLDNKDDTVENNSIEYQIATEVHLMNDRKGDDSTYGLDEGNIRYYGASDDVDNYVWLGDTYTSDYTFTSNGVSVTRPKDSKKLWRIIGVFDGQLKLITADPISAQGLSWDTSVNDTGGNIGKGINEWSQADLMKLLNPGYEEDSVNNSLYWNKDSGDVYTGDDNTITEEVSFENTGLSSDEKNMIDDAIWYLRTSDPNNGFPNYYYTTERQSTYLGKICSSGTECDDTVSRTTEWNGKVGLMYPSDYGYAADFTICNLVLSQYHNSQCSSNNWLFISNQYQWTISPRSNITIASQVFDIFNNGYFAFSYASTASSVRPAIYIKSEAAIFVGDGTTDHPYELLIK